MYIAPASQGGAHSAACPQSFTPVSEWMFGFQLASPWLATVECIQQSHCHTYVHYVCAKNILINCLRIAPRSEAHAEIRLSGRPRDGLASVESTSVQSRLPDPQAHCPAVQLKSAQRTKGSLRADQQAEEVGSLVHGLLQRGPLAINLSQYVCTYQPAQLEKKPSIHNQGETGFSLARTGDRDSLAAWRIWHSAAAQAAAAPRIEQGVPPPASGKVFLPGPYAIAHHIVAAWVADVKAGRADARL